MTAEDGVRLPGSRRDALTARRIRWRRYPRCAASTPAGPRCIVSAQQDLDRHCGPAAVAALFARRPQDVMRLFHTPERRREAGPHCAIMARHRRPYREVTAADLARIAGTQHHGGLVALALPRPVLALDPRNLPPSITAARVTPVLDGIGNPHNLGAIARSAAFFGCRALLLSGEPRQAGLSDAAFRTSEGGLEALDIYGAADLPLALRGIAPGILTVAAARAACRPAIARHPHRPGAGQ